MLLGRVLGNRSRLPFGIVIALLQALTQVQEMTLTFIPKIIIILLVTAVSGSFVGGQIFAFANETYGRIATGF